MRMKYALIAVFLMSLRAAFGQDESGSVQKNTQLPTGASTIIIETEVLLRKGEQTKQLSRFLLSREDFDRDGRCTVRQTYGEGGVVDSHHKWEYSHGFVRESHREGTEVREEFRWFAPDGQILREITTLKSADEVVSNIEQTWFRNGGKAEATIIQREGRLEEIKLYEYRSNLPNPHTFDLTSVTEFGSDGVIRSKTSYTYNESSKCIELVILDGKGTPIRRMGFEYDGSGRKIKEREWKGLSPIQEMTVKYDGSTLKEKCRTYFKKDSKIETREITEYDNYGEVIRVAVYEGEGLVLKTETLCKFTVRDSRGNWTVRETKSSNSDVDTSHEGWIKILADHRTITYHPE